MAQSIFDALSGVSLDSSTVQSLLESQNLLPDIEHSAIDQDEEDIFQCGKCKCQYTSLHMFLLHKRSHLKKQEQTVDLSQYLISDNSQVQVHNEGPCQDPTTQYNPTETFIQSNQLTEPIILEESDMLFSMDQENSSYLTADTEFGVPIILNTENLENFTTPSLISDDNLLKDDSDDVHQPRTSDTSQDNVSYDVSSSNEIVPIDNNIMNDIVEGLETQENNTSPPLNLKYKCNYCHKQFAKKFYWQQHERSHTGEKPYQCVVCGRAFAQKSNVKKHMSSHKVWPGTAIHSLPPEAPPDGSIDRTYHCQFCKEIFDSYKALKGHLIVSHMTLKVYKCVQNSCSMMFADLDDFLEHTRSHKRSEYRCHVCGEIFNTLSDLGLHQYVHSVQKQKTTEKYYCCTVCKSSFSNLEALQHHTETTTHDYACPHCGKSFLIERFLRRHLKTHVSSAKFACEDCGKAFKTEQYLANHKLIHSEETPFICPQCPARFKRKDRLGRHMLIHDLTKRLKCPFRGYLGCMSEFSRPDKLKRHLLTHSNIKRFTCIQCNRDFNRAQATKHHEMSKHTFKCDICSETFKNKDQLNTHNCNQTVETKKYMSSQLPRKASGTFKPRKPTPKRQMVTKSTAAGFADKEKLKTDEVDKRMVSSDLLMLDNLEDLEDKKSLIENLNVPQDINAMDTFIKSDSSDEEEEIEIKEQEEDEDEEEEDMTSEMDFQSIQESTCIN
ncbi:zinc finger protein 341-like isoform X1 [Microplitis mediator]|uniref:zinc finger protein 341-like isoform X1 n=1 Tax=Microplitis mediator TaxID=375433 RepID=UPI0025542723|nr:zinc finger protein 341-like isoform X1 [Microplitis mediator]